MKTAEEWARGINEHQVDTRSEAWVAKIVRQIQLDAMKEGMQMAADKLGKPPFTSYCSARNIILEAVEQITEKDI